MFFSSRTVGIKTTWDFDMKTHYRDHVANACLDGNKVATGKVVLVG